MSYPIYKGPRCSHWQDEVPIGELTVRTVASMQASSRALTTRFSDLGIYLDVQSWSKVRNVKPVKFADASSKVPVIHAASGDIIYVRWPDYGVIGLDRLGRLVSIALRNLREGRTVEIGCVGAHGRTGSLLAAMLVKEEGLMAGEAISEVRSRYCHNAVESYSQEKLIYQFAGEKPPAGSKYTAMPYVDWDKYIPPKPTSYPTYLNPTAGKGIKPLWRDTTHEVMETLEARSSSLINTVEDWSMACVSEEDEYTHWYVGDRSLDYIDKYTACGVRLDVYLSLEEHQLEQAVDCPKCRMWTLSEADYRATVEERRVDYDERFNS